MLLFLGDTTDHGTSAAFLAGMMVASCSLVAQMPASPKNLLETLHNALFSLFLSESSAEMISIVFDFNAKEITFSQAGYIPLLFYRKGSDPVALQKPGSRVAFTKRFFCEETVIQYKPNDIFVISTDGIAEARLRGSVESEEERYGMERLNSLLVQNADRGCSEIFEAIYTDVTESSLIEDDTTIIVLKMR